MLRSDTPVDVGMQEMAGTFQKLDIFATASNSERSKKYCEDVQQAQALEQSKTNRQRSKGPKMLVPFPYDTFQQQSIELFG